MTLSVSVSVCVCPWQMLLLEGLRCKHISGNYDFHWPSPGMLLAILMERGRTHSPRPVTHRAQDTGQDCVLCLLMTVCSVKETVATRRTFWWGIYTGS